MSAQTLKKQKTPDAISTKETFIKVNGEIRLYNNKRDKANK